jgi:hypothetical protein
LQAQFSLSLLVVLISLLVVTVPLLVVVVVVDNAALSFLGRALVPLPLGRPFDVL